MARLFEDRRAGYGVRRFRRLGYTAGAFIDAVWNGMAERAAEERRFRVLSGGERGRRRRGGLMDDFTRDVKHAARALARSPGFAAIAILTIGLGIGANTAIFSVVNAVLLRPLPYPSADRLVYVWAELPNRDITQFPASPPDVRDYREQATSLDAIEGVFTFPQPLTSDDADPEQVQVGGVTPGLLALLGARPQAGRLFNDDDAAPVAGGPAGQGTTPAPAAVILSDGLWRRRFGADARVIGRTVQLGGAPATVIGVLQPGFRVLMPATTGIAADVDLWAAPRIDYVTAPRGNVFLRLIGRLRPGVSLAQAQQEMDRVAAGIAAKFPRYASAGFRVRLAPIRADITAKVRSAVLTLLGAVAFVLLIACANVSNLMLVRATTKEGEWAVRAAMGAGRARLIRQSLVESGMIALAGAVVGVTIAAAGIRVLLLLQPGDLPRLDEVRLDGTVLGYAAIAATLAAGLFGAIPALRASRVDLARSLRDRGRSAHAKSHHLARSVIVVLEVALSLVLLVGAGLMVRSFAALRDIDPGFEPEGAVSFTVSLPGNRYPTAVSRSSFWLQLQDRLSGMATVQAVSAGWPLPLAGQIINSPYGTEEILTDPQRTRQADVRIVLPGYFETMGTHLLEGRTFTRADETDSTSFIVVDRTLAEKTWPGQSAVGKRLLLRMFTPEPLWVEVIGVVEHQRNASLAAEGPEAIFVTDRYPGGLGLQSWIVRGAGSQRALIDAARAQLAELDPSLPIADVQPLSDYVTRAMAPARFALILIGIFGAAALVLASIGLYGVLSYVVRQRTAEIGVRVAFGARPGKIMGMVVGQGLRLAAAGMVLGLAAALALTRVLSSLLVGVHATDPPTYIAVSLLFAAVAAAAAFVPAYRATRVDPVIALRDV
jgi:putative ABC transport system permease protein